MYRSVLFVALLACTLSAQRPVFRVGGSNPTHATIAQAVAAAPPDSVILVGPGGWAGFNTNKPLVILLDFDGSGGTLSAPSGTDYAIVIHDLPPAGEFVIKGRGSNIRSGRLGGIRIVNCYGTLSLEGLSISAAAVGPALEVSNASVVNIQHSLLLGAPALQVSNAILTSHDCTIAGSGTAAEGIVSVSSNLELALGGYAGTGAPAIRCFGGWLRMAGDGTTPVRVYGSTSAPTSAIEAVQMGVLWDPASFSLTSTGGAPYLLDVAATVGVLNAPSLVGTCGGVGSIATTRLTRRGAGAGLIILSGRIVTPILSTVGYRWLEPTLFPTVIAIGAVTPTGIGATISIPPDPLLLGYTFGVQGAVLEVDLIIESNPAHLTIL